MKDPEELGEISMKKIGAVILSNDRRQMIVVRKKGKHTFIIPGGRPEGTESDIDTLRRELREELNLEVVSCSFLGEFCEEAAFGEGTMILRVYDVSVSGEPKVDSEIEEAAWIDADYAREGLSIASGLSMHVVPLLTRRGDLVS